MVKNIKLKASEVVILLGWSRQWKYHESNWDKPLNYNTKSLVKKCALSGSSEISAIRLPTSSRNAEPSWLMEQMALTAIGINQWSVDSVLYLTFFRSAATSAAWLWETGKTLRYDAANGASQVNGFPAFHGINVRPSGFFAIVSY